MTERGSAWHVPAELLSRAIVRYGQPSATVGSGPGDQKEKRH